MAKRLKVIIGLTFSLCVILIALGVFIHHLVTKSYPKTTGSYRIEGVSQPVSIYRDELGIPHIIAENEEDAYMAIGFVHAQDRLWQMEFTRRIGEGRLSELFGSGTLEFDKMLRTIGFATIADGMTRNLDLRSLHILEAYTRGVNAYIEIARGKYPVEFDMLHFEPEPWTIEQSVMISRLMAWELNMAWLAELEMGDLVDRFGEGKAQRLIPSYPGSAPVIVPSSQEKTTGLTRDFRSGMFALRSFLGTEGTSMGSNSWVVSGARTTTGKPLLANDPHLTITNPSKWYQISVRGGSTLAVEGVSIPGVPAVVIGRNRDIAWGLTNVMADEADFFIEKIDSSDINKYIIDGKSRPMIIREEEIKVRDSASVIIQVRSTHHGPIVSDIHASKNSELGQKPTRLEQTRQVSMAWTGSLTDSDESGVFIGVNHATNWQDFRNAVRRFTTPGQNFIFADREGNIGYQAGVRIPVRGARSPLVPQPGWISGNDWHGFVPFELLPSLFNPPEGFIATANNKITGDVFPYYISVFWEPPARIIRIRELLKAQQQFSPEDFERIQNDAYSPAARELVPYILRAYDSVEVSDPLVEAALVYFKNWDFRFLATDVVTTIYHAWYIHLIRNTLLDELGEDGLFNYMFLSNIPLRVMPELLHDSTSVWFDDIHTPQIETRDDIIRKSLGDAMTDLRSSYGDEIKLWLWGDVHTLRMRHIFGERKPLDRVFNLGPYPLGGASTAIISGEYSFNHPYEAVVAPSMRQIVDLSDSAMMSSVITSGASGQPFNRHFKDQVQLWFDGKYHTLTLDKDIIEKSGWDCLRLEPR
jgi:penicillin G amidase